MDLISINPAEFEALLKQLQEIKKQLSEKQRNPDEIIYDNADAMRLLKVSRRTLQSWRTAGLISFSQVGSKLYYTQQDISEFIQNHYNKRFA
jgi:hypothetical protein